MTRNYRKMASLVCAGVLILSSLTITGCTPKPTKTTRDTADVTSAVNTPTPTNTPSPSPTPDPKELLRQEAVKKANSVHMEEAELHGKHELFLEYAEIVDENPDLDCFRNYVYHIFPIVADHLKEEKKAFFLDKLSTLHVVKDGCAYGNAGEYYDSDNEVLVDLEEYQVGQKTYNRTVFHELVHFIDYQIDGDSSMVYRCKGKYINALDMTEKDWSDFETSYDARFIVEGGAELYTAKYFTYGTVTYEVPTVFMTGLEHIYGSEFVDDLFFSYNTTEKAIHLFLDNGFTDKEMDNAFQVLNHYTYPTRNDLPKNPMLIKDILIRLYEKEKGDAWKNDKLFLSIVRSVAEYESENAGAKPQFPEDADLYIWEIDQTFDYLNSILEQVDAKKTFWFSASGIPGFFFNGEYKVGGHASIMEKDGEDQWSQSVLIDYDFNTDKVLNAEYKDEFIPEDVVEKFPEGSELNARLDELRHDNSAMHQQENPSVSADDPLSEVRKKAVDIGNKYGIKIYIGDSLPIEEVIMCDYDIDPERSSQALDAIDTILSRYPKDLFDQLCFGYIYGIDIFLMNFSYPEERVQTHKIDGKWHNVIYLDSSSQKTITQYERVLAYDISLLIDRFMMNYNENLSMPLYSYEDWKNFLPYFIEYCGKHYTPSDETYKEYKQYFLSKDGLISPSLDRAELFTEIMKAAIAKENPEKKIKYKTLSQECLDRCDYYFRTIRSMFDTTDWPESTIWEKELKEQVEALQEKAA